MSLAAASWSSEACRPCTTTRHGFTEGQGAGVQLVASAQLALEMGLPIYAIVAGVCTATDKQGRSVPAPGSGILSNARELPTEAEQAQAKPCPLLSVDYRRRQLQRELALLDEWVESEAAMDAALRQYDRLHDVDRSMRIVDRPLRAAIADSIGFRQAGGVGAHPRPVSEAALPASLSGKYFH